MTVTQVKTVQKWAQDRGLYEFGDFETQSVKFYEEYGEYCKALLKNNEEEKIDSIGDMLVVFINMIEFTKLDAVEFVNLIEDLDEDKLSSEKHLVISIGIATAEAIQKEFRNGTALNLFYAIRQLAWKINYSATCCLEVAIDEIINRKGSMINGSFVKE